MIIDAHSHVGKDYYFGESTLSSYDKFCVNNKIDIGFLMPMPWPVIKDKDGREYSFIWESDVDKKTNLYKVFLSQHKVYKNKVISNPYINVNKYYYDLIQNTNMSTNIFFVPLVHGCLDSPEVIEKMIKKINPIAVKFHGFSGGFFAEDINLELAEILRFYDVPIIIHTSVYNYNDGYGVETKFWRNKCNPKSWADFLIKNKLKGTLNHGACLDDEVIKLVNKSDNIMIGIGPDLDISNDPYKVSVCKESFLSEGYLKILKKRVDPKKLLFDVDYNWNIDLNGNFDNFSIQRISSTWSYRDCEDIFCDNAKRFYKIGNK